jgi:hypothetical protein
MLKVFLARFLKITLLYLVIISILAFYINNEPFSWNTMLKMGFKALLFGVVLSLVFGLRKKR